MKHLKLRPQLLLLLLSPLMLFGLIGCFAGGYDAGPYCGGGGPLFDGGFGPGQLDNGFGQRTQFAGFHRDDHNDRHDFDHNPAYHDHHDGSAQTGGHTFVGGTSDHHAESDHSFAHDSSSESGHTVATADASSAGRK
jgi:hypothetical protein